jgi:hypothetical protein
VAPFRASVRLGLFGLVCVLLCAPAVPGDGSRGQFELGFVGGRSIFAAASDGSKVHAVLWGARVWNFDPAWSSSGRLAVTPVRLRARYRRMRDRQ